MNKTILILMVAIFWLPPLLSRAHVRIAISPVHEHVRLIGAGVRG